MSASIVALSAVELFRRAKELERRIIGYGFERPVTAVTSWEGESVVVRTEVSLSYMTCVSITRYLRDGTIEGPISHAEERAH
jgi:hypothetical protein